MNTPIRIENFPLKDQTELIIGMGFEIHKILGFGFREIVYKDAYEYEFKNANVEYEREKEYPVRYKNIILPHRFDADFVVFGKIILEVKAKEAVSNEEYVRTINYLKCSGCKVGLIVNFGRMKLGIKRVVL